MGIGGGFLRVAHTPKMHESAEIKVEVYIIYLKERQISMKNC